MWELLDQITSYVKNFNAIVAMLQCFYIVDNSFFLLTANSDAIFHKSNAEEGSSFLTLALETLKLKVRPS